MAPNSVSIQLSYRNRSRQGNEQPRPDTESAVDEAFRLPELLEAILMYLSPKDVLVNAQRVSTQFRRTVQDSNRLQRALFLAPASPSHLFSVPWPRKPDNNSLLLRVFPGHYPTVSPVTVYDSPTSRISVLEPHVSTHYSYDVYISFPADKLPNCNAAVHYPEASWRKMFLTQPPSTRLYLARRYQRATRPAMIREGGITMGSFVDEAQLATGWHESFISSDGDWHFEGSVECDSVDKGGQVLGASAS